MEGAYVRRTRTAHPKFRSVAIPASALISANLVLMYLVASTPLSALNSVLFQVPILGLLVYGAALTGGSILAERGLERDSMGIAVAGIVLLQGAYALFGGGILAAIAAGSRIAALGVTLVVTLGMTLAIGGYVYLRDREFDHWGRWSLGAFIVGALLVAVGSLFPIVLLGGFVFIFLGFTLRLGYEIWHVRSSYAPDRSLIHALGIYVAFTGVFVHVLQIVARNFLRE